MIISYDDGADKEGDIISVSLTQSPGVQSRPRFPGNVTLFNLQTETSQLTPL